MSANPRPILYSFRRCPYAMRARMAIASAGLRVSLREILLRDKPAEMLDVSSKGTVPVLITTDGLVIDESLDVMYWALEQFDPEHWLSADQEDTKALVTINDGPFKHHLDRYKYTARYDGEDAEPHRAAGFKILEDWAERLTKTGFFFGASSSLADIALFPFVRQFRIADPAWFDAEAPEPLRVWLTHHMDHKRFKKIMVKHPLWKDTGEEIDFPLPA